MTNCWDFTVQMWCQPVTLALTALSLIYRPPNVQRVPCNVMPLTLRVKGREWHFMAVVNILSSFENRVELSWRGYRFDGGMKLQL